MRLTDKVQELIHTNLQPGDYAIDATAGNGYDTLGLAQAVGPNGQVFAIDIQIAALDATTLRLSEAKCLSQCQCLLGDHSHILQSLEARHSSSVQIITFNLGYLPGSDKALRTTTETTLPALCAASRLLKTGGRLMITAYRGHPGGLSEAKAVEEWLSRLDPQSWQRQTFEPEVKSERIPPILHIALKMSL